MTLRRFRPLATMLSVSIAAAWIALPTSAHAEESAYCRKVRARAAADAALLIAPRVLLEGVKAPSPLDSTGKQDSATPNTAYQLRGGASISPLNMYKGVRTMDAGDADCEEHEAEMPARELLRHASDFGRLTALKEQAAYLESKRGEWESVMPRSAERFEAHTSTLLELEEVRNASTSLARQREQVSGEISRIEATGIADYQGSIPQLIKKISDKTMTLEREASSVRRLDQFTFNITGGYLPPIYGPHTGDFFGSVQLGWSFGAPFQDKYENRYLSARQEELKTARYELAHDLEMLKASVHAAKTESSNELEIIGRRVKELEEARLLLESSEIPHAAQRRDRIVLELIAMESERVFLAAYVRELSRLENN